MQSKHLLRAICLILLVVSFIPARKAGALVSSAPPPADMFQLPWDQGVAWVAIDGLDNGSKRPPSSSHNYRLGGAIDFAPKANMVTGENTSNYWVTAAAAGTVIQTSSCDVTIAHAGGWVTQYQFLGNVKVKLGDAVARNQRLGIIANGVQQKYCPGYADINVPHLHFTLRPSIVGATFAGWEVKYSSLFNITTFNKGLTFVGLYKPLMNTVDVTPTPTATTPTANTPSVTPSFTPTRFSSPTPTLMGTYVSTTIAPASIEIGGTALVTVALHDVPAEGYTSAEFTCGYAANLFGVSNIQVGSLFGADAALAINGPGPQRFIVAIAGSNGNKATSSGTAFTFQVTGLEPGQTIIDCKARVSQGNNLLTEIPSAYDMLQILGSTPTPNLTPSTTPVITQPPASDTPTTAPSVCDQAQFIADVTVPAGTVFQPGAQFTKTWRLQNVGTCTWTTAYQLVFFSGEQMSAVSAVSFPVNVMPGQSADFTVSMTAPSLPGSYQGNWMLKNSSGSLFGVGAQANQPFSVDIVVAGASPTPGVPSDTPTPSPTPLSPIDTVTPGPSATPAGPVTTPITGLAYDFASQSCEATWFSGAGQLPCPGVDGDPKGFVLKLTNPQLETGAIDPHPGLLTVPQNVQNGYIQGFYPPFHVQSGDRFRATINCAYGATVCYTAFRLDYQVGSDPIKTFWGPFLERYDGNFYSIDIDLTSLAGKDVKFILTSLAAGSPTGDRPVWAGPIIYRAGGTATPLPSGTPMADWQSYWNAFYGFGFLYPPQAQIMTSIDSYAKIALPIVPGTNLSQKYLEVIVAENPATCRSPLATESILETSQTVVINGISFLKETGQDGSAGHTNKWNAYSTSRNNVCVSLDFVLRAANPGSFATPPPLYDEAAESAVFGQIVATYVWSETPTATPFEIATATFTPTPNGSATPPFTVTPGSSPTPSSVNGAITGQVSVNRPVTINVYDVNNLLVASTASSDGTFRLEVAPGTYKVVAIAQGFLPVERTLTLNTGITNILPAIPLSAGDVDGNNVVDQFDALTIGMSYNGSTPAAADLNNDGIINVLDLELLAKNYRKTGPLPW